jgi:lipid-A-disaccharide synthase
LVRELKRLLPDAYFFGAGSDNMRSEGVDVKIDVVRRGSIGFLEALPNLVPLYFAYLKLCSLLKSIRPDLVILIDSQGLNLPLAKAAKKMGIKTVYYISPQEWLWGTPRGTQQVIKSLDLIVSIFEKEHLSYCQAGGNSVYFGHPLIDIVQAHKKRDDLRREYFGKVDGPVISLCPGSRQQEIRGLLPIFLKAGELIQKEIPSAKFILPAASAETIKTIFHYIGDFRPKAIVGKTYDLLVASDLAICASGTINLEAAILNVPNIMVYKLTFLSYLIGRYIFKIQDKLPYFSMPNYLLNENAIPE